MFCIYGFWGSLRYVRPGNRFVDYLERGVLVSS